MEGFTRDSCLSPKVIELLTRGKVPGGFENVEGEFFNLGAPGDLIKTPRWAKGIMYGAAERIRSYLKEHGLDARPTKAESPNCYVFPGNGKFKLTQDLLAAGWVQWQCVIQVRSDKDCAEAGVKRKKYRFAVHAWMNPADGELAMVKVKLQGKTLPRECAHCRGLGHWPPRDIAVRTDPCNQCSSGGVWD